MGIADSLARFDTLANVDQHSALTTGADVTNIAAIRTRTNRVMGAASKLKGNGYTDKQAIKAAQDRGKVERRLLATQKFSKETLGRVSAQIGILRTATAHSKAMMGYEQQVQDILAEHGMAVMGHSLDTQITQQHFAGYRSAATGSAWENLT